ncbi:MAG: 50S ribosomal protein L4 [Clostridiales bacterium]|nr:50S ribosomal protein L4 [Clostridiales bacterium]MDD7432830.1 50S ribosomal protein L4 [Clostridiales bacterium]MDY3061498.1 50S ribosomal protein L4 [Eubacteriales bacterium]
MATIDLYNMKGQVVKQIEVKDEVFGITPNHDVLQRAVIMQLANKRQGTSKAKGRSEVSGGGRKPYRQKGTGRARQGSIRAAQHVGGGVIFGPVPRSYRTVLPRKMRQLAMKSALSACYADNKLKVVDDLKLEAIKTKEMAQVLSNLEAEKSTLLVLEAMDLVIRRSAANLPGVKLELSNTINVFDLLKFDHVVFTEAALRKVEEVYA